MHNVKLPHRWTVYLYDKTAYKQLSRKAQLTAKPHTAICTLETLNDLIYFLQLMEAPIAKSIHGQKINLDANDYIIMRENVEPVWEHPRNKDGGTFTMIVPHEKGYALWSLFVMHLVGETLTDEMSDITGITSAFMYDVHNTSGGLAHTYIKIWDSKPNRDKNSFVDILVPELASQITDLSLQYLPNNTKRHFGQRHAPKVDRKNYGGFRRK